MYKYLDDNSYAVTNHKEGQDFYPFQQSEPLPFGKEPWRAEWEKEVEKRQSAIKVEKKEKQKSKAVLKQLELLEKVPEEFRSKLVYESDEDLRKMDVVFILDMEMNVVDVVRSKGAVRAWVVKQGLQSTPPGRQTIYNHIKQQRLYHDKYFFVPLKNCQNLYHVRDFSYIYIIRYISPNIYLNMVSTP